MKRKIFRISIAIVLALGLLASLVAANIHQNKQVLKDVNVILNDEDLYSFLNKDAIRQILIENRNLRLSEMSFGSTDIESMERLVLTNPWVKQADVFIDNNYILNVKVEQRLPVARLFYANGSNYYMDSAMYMMPPTLGFSFPTLIFTDVPMYKNEEQQKALHNKIRYISQWVANNEFWKKQITQIAVLPNEDFKISSLIGNQAILFGDTSRMQEKFENLLAFYKDVAVKIGWEKYEQLDVRFKGQVIGYPSLGWVAPKAKDTVIILPDEASNINDIMSSLPEQPLIVKQEQQAAEKPKTIAKEKEQPKNELQETKKDSALNFSNKPIQKQEKRNDTVDKKKVKVEPVANTSVKKQEQTKGSDSNKQNAKAVDKKTTEKNTAVKNESVIKKDNKTDANNKPKYTYPSN